jgi:hypothetical protein
MGGSQGITWSRVFENAVDAPAAPAQLMGARSDQSHLELSPRWRSSSAYASVTCTEDARHPLPRVKLGPGMVCRPS